MVRVYYNGDKSGSCYAAGRSLLCLRSAGLRPNLRFSSFDKNRKNKKHLMVLFIFFGAAGRTRTDTEDESTGF